jgi:hypothetical protein
MNLTKVQYDQFRANGWTDAQLLVAGHVLPTELAAVPPPPPSGANGNASAIVDTSVPMPMPKVDQQVAMAKLAAIGGIPVDGTEVPVRASFRVRFLQSRNVDDRIGSQPLGPVTFSLTPRKRAFRCHHATGAVSLWTKETLLGEGIAVIVNGQCVPIVDQLGLIADSSGNNIGVVLQ